VTFKQGSTVLRTGALSGGVASFSTSSLNAGTLTITAVYPGDAALATSSGTVKQTVKKATTATTLTSSPNPSSAGQTVTFTSVVSSSAGTPGGTVTFKQGTTTLGAGRWIRREPRLSAHLRSRWVRTKSWRHTAGARIMRRANHRP